MVVVPVRPSLSVFELTQSIGLVGPDFPVVSAAAGAGGGGVCVSVDSPLSLSLSL